MSRTGPEPKPTWGTLPPEVRAQTETLLGASVVRAARVWGGYSPTATYRLRLSNRRRAFLKAVGPSDGEFARAAHSRERRVYAELQPVIAGWAPDLLGTFTIGEWDVILLEDLGPKSAPPWTESLARQVAQAVSDFHHSTLGTELPDWLPRPEQHLLTDARLWRLSADPVWLRSLAGLSGPQADHALDWLNACLPVFAAASERLRAAVGPMALVHRDIRSDNLRWVQRRLRLFDWPHAGVGPAEDDAAMFVQSVTVEGGPDPETLMSWYGERMPVRAPVLDGAVASIAAFFADQAWRPEIQGLPRLRGFQRRQLKVTLKWASQRLALPPPVWVEAVDSPSGLAAPLAQR